MCLTGERRVPWWEKKLDGKQGNLVRCVLRCYCCLSTDTKAHIANNIPSIAKWTVPVPEISGWPQGASVLLFSVERRVGRD